MTPALTLTGGGGGGNYYRLVVTYTDGGGVAERLVSETVQVGTLDAAGTRAISGSLAVGGELSVTNSSGASSYQWQWDANPAGGEANRDWQDIAGATGSTFTIPAGYQGVTLRAVVTYTGSNGITEVSAVQAADNVAGTPLNTPPQWIKDTEVRVDDASKGLNTTVDLSELFQDAEGATLRFEYQGWAPETGDLRKGTFLNDAHDGVTLFNPSNGKLIWFTDEPGAAHDGDGRDGMGNKVTIGVDARDDANQLSSATADVVIRINVAPTNITGGTEALSVRENDPGFYSGGEARLTIATLNVQDQNDKNGPLRHAHAHR